MWKKFKWDMFVTSFIPLWLSIVVLDAWNIVSLALEKWDDKSKMLENLKNILCSSSVQVISVIVIAFLVISSIVGINSFLKKKLSVKSTHPKGTVKKATKANKLSSEFLLAYILPMIAFDFGDPQKLVLFLIYFLVLAYLCIRNNNIYTNILLEFKGYRIYTCDFECMAVNKNHIYHDSIVISKIDLTQEEGNEVPYWDFENYIYITVDRGGKQ